MTSVITPPVGKVKRVNIIICSILQRVRSTCSSYSCSGRSRKVSGSHSGSSEEVLFYPHPGRSRKVSGRLPGSLLVIPFKNGP